MTTTTMKTAQMSLRDSLDVAKLRAQRMTFLAGMSLNRRATRREAARGPAVSRGVSSGGVAQPREPRDGFEIGDLLWPALIGMQLAALGPKARIYRTADANMTLEGDTGDMGGEVAHPAARPLGTAIMLLQFIALLMVATVPGVAVLTGQSMTFVTTVLTGWELPAWGLGVLVAVSGVVVVPAVLEALVSLRTALPIWGLKRRVRQLRADGEAIVTMSSYVRRKNTGGAGQAMARPVIDRLGQWQVIVVGIAANKSLVTHYLELGAKHDTPDGTPGKHRRMRFDYPDRELPY